MNDYTINCMHVNCIRNKFRKCLKYMSLALIICLNIHYADFKAFAQASKDVVFDFSKAQLKGNTKTRWNMSIEEAMEALQKSEPEQYKGIVKSVEECLCRYVYDNGITYPFNMFYNATSGIAASPGKLKISFDPRKSIRVTRIRLDSKDLVNNRDKYTMTIVVNGEETKTAEWLGYIGIVFNLDKPVILSSLEIRIDKEDTNNMSCLTKMSLINANASSDKEEITEWKLTAERIEGRPGEELDLPIVISQPEDASIFVEYESSNPEIFTIEGGKIKLKQNGEALLMAKVGENNVFRFAGNPASVPVIVSDVANYVSSLESDNPDNEIKIYDLQGRIITKPTAPGIYIERRGAKIRKVIIK